MPFFIIYAESEEALKSNRGELVWQSTAAAAKLGVHERKIRAFVAAGELTPVDEKFGCSPCYRDSDIAKLAEKRKKTAY